MGYDHVTIPGALKSSTGAIQGKDKLCGRSVGLVTTKSGTTAATICSRRTPFSVQFLSDNYEFVSGLFYRMVLRVGLLPLVPSVFSSTWFDFVCHSFTGDRGRQDRRGLPPHLHPVVHELLIPSTLSLEPTFVTLYDGNDERGLKVQQ